MQRWIVLVGAMGAGKTAVGRAVAAALRLPFLDLDEEIERAAAMPVADIFARDGEAFFRAREAEVLARLLAGRAGVLATGGGAWLSEENRRVIDAAGLSVWLAAHPDTLWRRVRKHRPAARPLLRTEDPRATLCAIAEARAPLYARAAARVETAPEASIEEVARRVIEVARPPRPRPGPLSAAS